MPLLVLAVASSAAAEVRSITLTDAIRLALARNPTLGAARFAVLEADAEQLRGTGAYDTTLELSASGVMSRHDGRVQPLPQELARDAAVASATVAKSFVDGTRAQVRVSETAERTTTQFPTGDATTSNAQRTYAPKLETELDVPLYGGREVGSTERDRLAALRDATDLERTAIAEDVVRDVEQAYWELAFAQRETEIRGHSASLAETQLHLVEAEIARGARPKLAAAEVEDELARRREDALLATGQVSERSVALASLLGLAPTTELRVADAPGDPAPVDREHALALALAHSPRVAEAIRKGDASAAELDRADDEARWRVDVFVRGSLESDSDTARDAWRRAAGYGGWTVEAGVSLRLPVAGAGPRGAIGAARAKLTRSRIQIADAEAQVAAQLTRAIGRLDIAVLRRSALARSVELAQTNLDAEQRRWERGDTTSFEVLRRQTALADAKLRAERARIDAISARAAIDALTGALLERHGVTARAGGSTR